MTFSQAFFFNKNNEPKFYEPPVSIPFDLTKKGNKTEVLVEITKERSYSFELQFFYTDDVRIDLSFMEKVRSFFPSDPREDENYEELQRGRERVEKLLGYEELIKSGTGKTYQSQWIKHPGIKTPTHLTIIKLENDGSESVVLDEVFEDPKNMGIAGSFRFRMIGGKYLNKGKYKFTIESLKDSPEFTEIKIHLWISEHVYK